MKDVITLTGKYEARIYEPKPQWRQACNLTLRVLDLLDGVRGMRWARIKLNQLLPRMATPKGVLPVPNTVMTLGKNYLLDNGMAGSGYTAAVYMGLISSTSYSAISAADTAASHAGWLEAGGSNAPTYSGNRKTVTWSAASSGSKVTDVMTFTLTGVGTIKGVAMWFTTATKDATTGTLFSAGLSAGGDDTVKSGDFAQVTYTLSA